jgi:outer membrane protein assembly factor BamA
VGNKGTDEQFIKREMTTKVGTFLTAENLETDRLRLESSGLFNRVVILPVIESRSAVINVIVTEPFYFYVYPTAKWEYPYRGDEKTYGLGLQHRNFNGFGERIILEVSAGDERGGKIAYQDPFFRWGGNFALEAEAFRWDRPLARHDGIVDRRRNVGIDFAIKHRFNYDFLVELHTTYESINASVPGFVLSTSGRDNLLTSRVVFRGDRRDFRPYPSKGYYTSATVEANRLMTAPKSSFYREAVDLRYYIPVDRFIIATRFYGLFSQEPLPAYRQLELTTSQVRSEQNFGTNGETMMSGSVDLRFNLFPIHYYNFDFIPYVGEYLRDVKVSLEGLVFTDYGYVYYKENASRDQHLYAYGFGLQTQMSYIQVGRLTFGWNPESRLSDATVILSTGVTF